MRTRRMRRISQRRDRRHRIAIVSCMVGSPARPLLFRLSCDCRYNVSIYASLTLVLVSAATSQKQNRACAAVAHAGEPNASASVVALEASSSASKDAGIKFKKLHAAMWNRCHRRQSDDKWRRGMRRGAISEREQSA